MRRRRPTGPIEKRPLLDKAELHRKLAEANAQEMASNELRALLDEIKQSLGEGTPDHRNLSESERIFVMKAAKEIYKKDKQRAEHILASFGLPQIKTRKGLMGH